MVYSYECTNPDCKECAIAKDVDKPMSEYKREEFCEECEKEMQRVFSIGGHQTFGDGYKS